jgi:membrane protease YdiL (CAAX protease family)
MIGLAEWESGFLFSELLAFFSGIRMIPAEQMLLKILPMPDLFKNVFSLIAGPAGFAGSLLFAGLVAPIVEEILFRGVLLQGFMSNYTPPVALLLSAVLFGFAHLNPWQHATGFVLGAFIGFTYMNTRSIVPGLVCHGLYNGGLVMLGRVTHPDLASVFSGNSRSSLILGAFAVYIGIGLTSLAIWILWKPNRRIFKRSYLRSVE